MSNIAIALVCARCSHDWIHQLSDEDSPRLMNKGGREVKIYRVNCPICGGQMLVEVDDAAAAPDAPKGYSP